MCTLHQHVDSPHGDRTDSCQRPTAKQQPIRTRVRIRHQPITNEDEKTGDTVSYGSHNHSLAVRHKASRSQFVIYTGRTHNTDMNGNINRQNIDMNIDINTKISTDSHMRGGRAH